jgi:hypothetical protein
VQERVLGLGLAQLVWALQESEVRLQYQDSAVADLFHPRSLQDSLGQELGQELAVVKVASLVVEQVVALPEQVVAPPEQVVELAEQQVVALVPVLLLWPVRPLLLLLVVPLA